MMWNQIYIYTKKKWKEWYRGYQFNSTKIQQDKYFKHKRKIENIYYQKNTHSFN